MRMPWLKFRMCRVASRLFPERESQIDDEIDPGTPTNISLTIYNPLILWIGKNLTVCFALVTTF